jgi:hypothetical protein
MLMRAELPIERSWLSDTLVKDLGMVAVFAGIGAVALGLASAFPIPADIAAAWLAQFPG